MMPASGQHCRQRVGGKRPAHVTHRASTARKLTVQLQAHKAAAWMFHPDAQLGDVASWAHRGGEADRSTGDLSGGGHGVHYRSRGNLDAFDPGTQGEHKLARGFEPTLTQSAHWLAHGR